MSAKQALANCSFFMKVEATMLKQGRKNIANYARRQHEKYFRLAMQGME